MEGFPTLAGMTPAQRRASSRRRLIVMAVAASAAAGFVGGAVAAASLLPAEESAASAEQAVGDVALPGEFPAGETPPEVPAAAEVPEVIEPEPFDYGDCPPAARACVDLDGERAWLQKDGEVTYGAVPIGQGGPGYDTPRASFHVSRKVVDDVSYVFDMAPMPYAVYFTDVGHAFHEGDPEGESHGCVRLAPGDAEIYFNELQVGDLIHIY